MVRLAVLLTPAYVALMEAVVTELTADVVIVNPTELAPALMLTVVGTCALALELVRAIVIPPACAGPVSVTVPVEDFPPTRELGTTLKEVSAAG
jgi:hypothetical protein